MHLGFPIANDERYGGLRVPDWRHVRRACFDKAGLEPDADCAELDVDNRHKNVDDAETRRELWLKAKDKSCMHCIDVTAGIWADRFHFLKPAATEPKAESESIDNNTTHTMSDDAQPQPQSQPQPQQRQVIPMGETTTGETAASAVSSGAAQGLTGVSFKEQCCNSGNASTAEVEWDGNVPVRDGEVAMDVFPDKYVVVCCFLCLRVVFVPVLMLLSDTINLRNIFTSFPFTALILTPSERLSGSMHLSTRPPTGPSMFLPRRGLQIRTSLFLTCTTYLNKTF
jgi:hypothetical protein